MNDYRLSHSGPNSVEPTPSSSKGIIQTLTASFKSIPETYRSCVQSYQNYTKEASLSEKLIYECMDFGKKVKSDKGGGIIGNFLYSLPSLQMTSLIPSVIKLQAYRFSQASNAIDKFGKKMDAGFQSLMKSPGHVFQKIGLSLVDAAGKDIESSLQQNTAGKVALTAAKILLAPAKMVAQGLKIGVEATVRGTYLLTLKTPIVLLKGALDTADVLANKSYTEIIGRTIALLSATCIGAAYLGTHPLALIAGVAAAKTVAPAVALPVGITMGIVEGYFHGEPMGEMIARSVGLDVNDRKMTNRAAVGACMVSGVACVAAGATIKGVSATEIFVVGGVGKAVVVGGTVFSTLLGSVFYHLGRGIIRGAQSKGVEVATKNMFYEDGIMSNGKQCMAWMKEKLDEFGKPLTDITDVWKTPNRNHSSDADSMRSSDSEARIADMQEEIQ